MQGPLIFQQMEKVVTELICQVKDIARLWVEMGAKKLRSVSEDPLWLVQCLVFVFIICTPLLI